MIILFDLDGTLIDSTEAILESFHHAFDVHKASHPNNSEIEKLIGHPLDVMFEELGVSSEVVWDYVDTYKNHYREISTQKTVLLENAREAVEKASVFATLGVVTTKTAKYSKVLLEHFALMHYFEVLIGREDVENPKPHAEPIQKALKQLDTRDDEIWMIGDTSMDLLSAKNAEVNAIGVLSGYGQREELEEHCEIVYEDVLEAIDFLEMN